MDKPIIRYWTTSEVVGPGNRKADTGLMVEASTVTQARRAAAAELRNNYPGARIKVLTAEPAPERYQ